MPAPHHSRKWLDRVSGAYAYALCQLRNLRSLCPLGPYACAYTYRGVRAFASLSTARSVGRDRRSTWVVQWAAP
jgi:hypothetical protein